MKNLKLALVASLVSLSTAGVATAAQDGNLGLTSTGESIVTIIKQNAVQITNVADLDLGIYATLAADVAADDDVCVFSSTGGYSVTLSGAGAGFTLDGGAAGAIPYLVQWAAGGAPAVPVVPGTPIVSQPGDATSLNCNGGTNANFAVSVSAALFNAAAPGTYTDTLTLLVEPE